MALINHDSNFAKEKGIKMTDADGKPPVFQTPEELA